MTQDVAREIRYLKLVIREQEGGRKGRYLVAPAAMPGPSGYDAKIRFWKLGKIVTPEGIDPAVYQNILYEALFPTQDSKTVLDRAVGYGAENVSLRLLLDLPEKLYHLKWESLRSADTNSGNYPITVLRYAGNQEWGSIREHRTKPIVLVIAAQSDNAPDISAGLDAEVGEIGRLAALHPDLDFQYIPRDAHTRQAIKDLLKGLCDEGRDRRHLEGIYFLGHGEHSGAEELPDRILFRSLHDGTDRVNAEQFLEIFNEHFPNPICNWIFLNACETAVATPGWPLWNFASALATVGKVPLVVGHPRQVADEEAKDLGIEFFTVTAPRSGRIDPLRWLEHSQHKRRIRMDHPGVTNHPTAYCRLREFHFSPEAEPARATPPGNHHARRGHTILDTGDSPAPAHLISIPRGPVRIGFSAEQRARLKASLSRFNWRKGVLERALAPDSSHEETVRKFSLSKHLITNREFAAFTAATRYKTTAECAGHPGWKAFLEIYPDHPVVRVSLDDAEAYCRWAKGRLPSVLEWQRACRGSDGRIYPWGDQFGPKFCNTTESGLNGTTPVGYFGQFGSPFGCTDLVGNVEEWTGRTSPGDERAVVVGGSFDMPCEVYGLTTTSRLLAPTRYCDEIGFRLAQ